MASGVVDGVGNGTAAVVEEIGAAETDDGPLVTEAGDEVDSALLLPADDDDDDNPVIVPCN